MAVPAIRDNISELSTILKTVYGPGVEQQQNLAAMLYKRFATSQVRFGGNAYEFPARMVNTQSVGARGYRVGLPQPIMNVDVTARVRHKFIYGTFDIAGPDIEKGKGNVNAYVNTQTYLDGSGVRAAFSSAVTAGVGTVTSTKYLRAGMQVNVISGTDGTTIRGGNGDSDPGDGAGTPYAAKRYTIMAIDASTGNIT